MQDNTQEATLNLKSAIAMNETQSSEFIHGEADPRASCTDHSRQHWLDTLGSAFRGDDSLP